MSETFFREIIGDAQAANAIVAAGEAHNFNPTPAEKEALEGTRDDFFANLNRIDSER